MGPTLDCYTGARNAVLVLWILIVLLYVLVHIFFSLHISVSLSLFVRHPSLL